YHKSDIANAATLQASYLHSNERYVTTETQKTRRNSGTGKILRVGDQASSARGYTSLMPDNSVDVVSVVDMPEVLNAVQQAKKEIQTRFDLKNSKSEIDLNEKDKKIVILSVDDFKVKSVVDVLQQKLAKRKVPLKNLTYGPIQPS